MVPTFLGDALRAPKVDVDGVAVILNVLGRLEQDVGVIRAELCDQGPVLGARCEMLPSVLLALDSSALRCEKKKMQKERLSHDHLPQ